VQEVLRLLHAEMINSKIVVTTDFAARLPPVRGDRTQLQQVFLNLVMNAIEAMRSESGPRTLHISSKERDGRIILAVRDSGPGVAAEQLDKIFDNYFTTKPNGMGMGLSICRSIAESHGADLSAALAEPHGMIFELSLPAAGGDDIRKGQGV
jgi:signal transduction histidine kinase